MKTSFPRLIAAVFALVFVLAACASESGTQWTFAPTTAQQPAEPGESAEASDSAAPESAPAEATEAPAQPEATPAAVAPASGEPRVVEMEADAALRFLDANGEPMTEIAVTPGETIVFRIDNTSGFAHNFYIGADEELSVPSGTTDVGIPDWESGVQELEWVVPDDITDLRYACTVPGHYFTMQGDFVLAETAEQPVEPAVEEPAVDEAVSTPAPSLDAQETPAAAEETPAAAQESPAAAEETTSSGDATAANGEPRVIELEADAAIRFMQGGEQLREIAVTPGETVIFRIDNTAGFPHNFYIGADSDLQVMGGTTDTGIPDWDSGVQEFEWVVPEDVSDIRFACTVPGHYYTMQGDFVVSP